ncbi:MAG: hypothetical protein KKG75_02990 [Nanoarchaeota archaeon]|nr:hypothetical protein [Nanoarchaeota archaeon]
MKEKSLFIEFMGDSPTVRVLDYLMTERDLDFSISDMARNVVIGRTTLYRIWDDLLKKEIILPTRIIGKAKLYKLNKENPKIQKIMELDDMICLEALRKRAEEQKVKMVA